jgi:heme-degrading monooxygenase HmoA
MIARWWHGAVPSRKADSYREYLLETGVADYRATPGNRGVYLLRRKEGDTAHFVLLTLWDSVDSIRAFAGPEAERARYYPEDEQYLLELEPKAEHYEVLIAPQQDA